MWTGMDRLVDHVAPRERRVSRNRRDHTVPVFYMVAPRERRVSRNFRFEFFHKFFIVAPRERRVSRNSA